MPSRAVGLTDAKIRGLTPPSSGQVELLDQLVGGLRVRVGASGGKTFILAGVYQRYDYQREKREALESWTSEVERILGATGPT